MNRLKKIFLWAILAGALYFVLSNHFIFVGKDVKVLKKSRLTLEYTIFSTQSKSVESILAIDDLRKDGIGELLVEVGKLSESQLQVLIEKYK
ncbi:MAG: hypothetical protein MUO52_14755 [Desulfobacterales bacterium]|nr:hypothetical protein [Desulfobacterales bacterium]